MIGSSELVSEPRVVESESLFSVTLRRTKYAVTIFLVASLFLMFAGRIQFNMAGVTAPEPLSFGLVIGVQPLLILTALMLVSISLAVFLTYPDSPHAGLFCAFLGLVMLSIRAGTLDFPLHLTRFSEGVTLLGGESGLFNRFAIQCLAYAGVAVLVNALGTHLFVTFCSNEVWVQRLGSHKETRRVIGLHSGAHRGAIEMVLALPRLNDANRWISALGAISITGSVAWLFLLLLLRNSTKGQAIFACFVAFGWGAFVAYQVFPKSPAWAMWAAAPLAGAVVFWLAHGDPHFPGHTTLAAARALPLDYLSAGVPGAIIGYYSNLKWQIHQLVHEP